MPALLTHALALALAVTSIHAPPSAGPGPEAAPHLERGIALHDEGRYVDAAKEFEAGYAIEPHPVFLFAWAQAERLGGNCAAAIELYRRFAATGPSPAQRAAADEQIGKCEELLAAKRAEAEPEPEPEPEPPPPEPKPESIESDDHEPPPPKRERVDPVGLSLVIVGSTAVVVGVALLATAGAQRNTADDASRYDDYESAAIKVQRFGIAGGVVAGIGIPLVIAGAVVWTKRNRARQGSSASAWIGPSSAGVSIARRF